MLKTKEEVFTLIAEIKQELNDLRLLSESIGELGNKLLNLPLKEKRFYVESAALELHNFYTGCERIFEKISGEINGGMPTTYDWHKRILKNMSIEIPKVRPQVISKDTGKRMLEYLRFRHLVRNIYVFDLEYEKINPLIENLPEVMKRFEEDIYTFLKFLESLAENL